MKEIDKVERLRSSEDEQGILIFLTIKGRLFKEEAGRSPKDLEEKLNLPEGEANRLYHLLYKLIDSME
ncbi:hypothetical protein [Desertivirga brevis]|uniref:hypothetical protein n=1 Tax=Desertivirga brevis TaxID=2810310 RepID=UPI001A965E12|nr:hypothetical protein [Pedobacter sp. SYSU D00873]